MEELPLLKITLYLHSLSISGKQCSDNPGCMRMDGAKWGRIGMDGDD